MSKESLWRVRRKQRDYPLGFKLPVVSQIEKGEMTYKQAQDRYGIQGRSTTLAWLRKIMGYELSDEMKAIDVIKALKMAICKRETQRKTIHHSDRGVQYFSAGYQNILKNNGMRVSMIDGYDCYHNALAERVYGILKQEFLLYRCMNIDELKKLVE